MAAILDGGPCSKGLESTIVAATGVFTWTPGESDGPGTFPVTLRVTDSSSNSYGVYSIVRPWVEAQTTWQRISKPAASNAF